MKRPFFEHLSLGCYVKLTLCSLHGPAACGLLWPVHRQDYQQATLRRRPARQVIEPGYFNLRSPTTAARDPTEAWPIRVALTQSAIALSG